MKIQNYRSINKGALVSSFDIIIPKWGNFTIKECKLFQKNGQRFISMPSKEYEHEGKKKYYSLVAFQEKDMFEKFSAQVLLAIDEFAKTQQAMPPVEQSNPVPF